MTGHCTALRCRAQKLLNAGITEIDMSTALPAYDIYYRAMLLAAEMALPYHGVPDPDETDSEQPVEPDSPEPSPNSPVLG